MQLRILERSRDKACRLLSPRPKDHIRKCCRSHRLLQPGQWESRTRHVTRLDQWEARIMGSGGVTAAMCELMGGNTRAGWQQGVLAWLREVVATLEFYNTRCLLIG